MNRICIFFFLLAASLFAEPKTVLITGAGSGIGASAVEAFQKRGWSVWAAYRSHKPAAIDGVHPIPLDVTDETSVREAIAAILAADGKIDVLVNNAGAGLIAAEESAEIEEVEKLFRVNFYGPLRLIQAAAPSMRERKSGHIINISSTSGARALPGLGFYAATKFALEALSESLAVTLSPWNIQVSIVEPGAVNNQFVYNYVFGTRPSDPLYNAFEQALYKKLEHLTHLGQNPDEIGELIAAIAENPAPDLRYQTSPKARETAAKKFIDPTGNALREEQILFFRSLFPEQNPNGGKSDETESR